MLSSIWFAAKRREVATSGSVRAASQWQRQAVRWGAIPTHKPASCSPVSSFATSNGKLIAKLAESRDEQRWRVRLWWFQWAGPSASIVNGFALASAFVPVQALWPVSENVTFSEPSSSKQRPGQSILESVAIQSAPCHNNGFNSDAGKLRAGKAGQARWRRRLTQTLCFSHGLKDDKRIDRN